MGPGCPVCVTDVPEVDEAVALARQGVRIATYGDMVRVPGTVRSRWPTRRPTAARVDVVYSVAQAVELAREHRRARWCSSPPASRPPRWRPRPCMLRDLPPNFSVLSAHKYIPPVMEIVAEMPETRVEGFLAAGHAATITGLGHLRALRRAPPDPGRGGRASSRSTSWPGW